MLLLFGSPVLKSCLKRAYGDSKILSHSLTLLLCFFFFFCVCVWRLYCLLFFNWLNVLFSNWKSIKHCRTLAPLLLRIQAQTIPSLVGKLLSFPFNATCPLLRTLIWITLWSVLRIILNHKANSFPLPKIVKK